MSANAFYSTSRTIYLCSFHVDLYLLCAEEVFSTVRNMSVWALGVILISTVWWQNQKIDKWSRVNLDLRASNATDILIL